MAYDESADSVCRVVHSVPALLATGDPGADTLSHRLADLAALAVGGDHFGRSLFTNTRDSLFACAGAGWKTPETRARLSSVSARPHASDMPLMEHEEKAFHLPFDRRIHCEFLHARQGGPRR